MKKRICIIGAGAAGLTCVRHLSLHPEYDVVVFEQCNSIGGIWVYEGTSPTPMYRDMRTNLPKEVMGFPDFPFSKSGNTFEDSASFIHNSTVLKYLEDYADHFKVREFIQLNKRVQLVRPIFDAKLTTSRESQVSKWEVTVQNTNPQPNKLLDPVDVLEFDYVIVCNGHFSKTSIPKIPNVSEFIGEILHSSDYRSPEKYAGKRVVIVGSGNSGIDIALEICNVAQEVIVSVRKQVRLPHILPGNITQMGLVESASCNGFILNQIDAPENSEKVFVPANALIYCTGYNYSFPFLSPECGIEILRDGKYVRPLLRQMIHSKYPSLCFIGIPQSIVPFPHFDCQIRYYMRYLDGHLNLPLSEEVVANHFLGDLRWAYQEKLAIDAGFANEISTPLCFGCDLFKGKVSTLERLEFVREMFEKVAGRRCKLPAKFKNDKIRIIVGHGDPKSVPDPDERARLLHFVYDEAQ